MTCFIVPTHLEVATVLSEAHGEGARLNDPLLLHNIIKWLEAIHIHAWFLRAKSHYSVSILAVEVLGLGLDAAKSVLKHVDARPRALTEVKRVFDYKAFVATTFGITLIESATVLNSTFTVHSLAVE